MARVAALCFMFAQLAGCDVEEVGFGAPEMTAVTVGELHSCAISEAGVAYCWGDNRSGQLGIGSQEARLYATRVEGSFLLTAIDAGGDHTCALTTDGRAVCWGGNAFGQLGTGDQQDADAPTLVSTSERFRAITAGFAHTCALTQNGRAFCWGRGSNGELGIGTSANAVTTPQPVAGSLVFSHISAGGRHTCALASGGLAYCWGANELAQLGNGTAGSPQLAPTRVDAAFAFSDISAGWNHSCAVTPSRVAYCWGENAYGEMGSGWDWEEGVPGQPSPQAVLSYGEIMFTQISAGRQFTCGRRDQGTIYCWGHGSHGQLGNAAATDFVVPQWVKPGPGRREVGVADVFAKVDAGSASHACGLAVDGTIYCWGNGANGQLGSGEWLTMIALPVAASD